MEELDDYIFQIPWIVDYRISRKGEILEIEGLTTEKGIEEKAGGLLPGEWKGRKLNCTRTKRRDRGRGNADE